jgi:hypothetical protein
MTKFSCVTPEPAFKPKTKSAAAIRQQRYRDRLKAKRRARAAELWRKMMAKD